MIVTRCANDDIKETWFTHFLYFDELSINSEISLQQKGDQILSEFHILGFFCFLRVFYFRKNKDQIKHADWSTFVFLMVEEFPWLFKK